MNNKKNYGKWLELKVFRQLTGIKKPGSNILTIHLVLMVRFPVGLA